MNKKLLTSIWIIATLSVVVLTTQMKDTVSRFYGIADDQEQTVRFDTAVEILAIHYIDGEQVEPGAMILEVRRPELTSKTAIVEDRISEIKNLDLENTGLLRGQVTSLREEMQARLADLDSKIHSLQSQHALNLKILEEISSEGASSVNSGNSPLLAEMENLKKQRMHVQRSMQAEIDSLVRQLESIDRPVDSQISRLNEQKSELDRLQTGMKVTASISGRIGNSFYKPGDIVPPFKPILRVYPTTPGFVRGYIHENVINTVQIDQNVWLNTTSSADGSVFIEGNIESLGSRIVEYPDRLKKTPVLSAWGREVIIRLDPGHSLLLGEKVEVTLEPPSTIYSHLHEIKQKYIPALERLAKRLTGSAKAVASSDLIDSDQNISGEAKIGGEK